MDHEFAGIKSESVTKALDAIHSHADCEGHRGALVNALITLTAGVPEDHHLSVILNCERRGEQTLRSILTFSQPGPFTETGGTPV